MAVNVTIDRVRYIEELAKLNPDTLALLAELSKKPGAEAKLKKNAALIKAFL